MAALHDGAGRDGEILAAVGIAAAVAAGPLRAVQALGLAAVAAHRAVRPTDARHRRAGGVFVLEIGGGEYVHGVLSAAILALAAVVSTI